MISATSLSISDLVTITWDMPEHIEGLIKEEELTVQEFG